MAKGNENDQDKSFLARRIGKFLGITTGKTAKTIEGKKRGTHGFKGVKEANKGQ